MAPALSTMWAQQDRFRGHMDDFSRIAAAAGYGAIEPSHSTDLEGLERLINSAILPIPSLHAPTPRQRDTSGRWNGDLNLAAIDEEERRAAVAHTITTIDYARRLGARAVVVHLGACGRGMLEAERRLRSLYQAGQTGSEEFKGWQMEARRSRAALATRHLPRAGQSLADLAEHAAQAGVQIGLETRLEYHEIPHFDELGDLIGPFPPDLVGYWHDMGHAEVQHRLGLVDRLRWLQAFGPRTVGAHLHDVAGIVDHRGPGQGDVDWSQLASLLPDSALRTFEINQHVPESFLASGLRLLVEQGVVHEASVSGRN